MQQLATSNSTLAVTSFSDRVYFPNLNGLRFLAAFLVIIHHVEQYKFKFGYPNYWNNGAVRIIGNLGVVLFFVLSGFLITYLLLTEKARTNNIAVSSFYKRRILRIWPLYYLVVLPAFLVWPNVDFLAVPEWTEAVHEHFEVKLLLFIAFFPNLANAAFNSVPFAAQAWSVGVEEQFYFIWPWLVKWSKRVALMLGLVILICCLVKGILFFVNSRVAFTPARYMLAFWNDFNIDCMALGGLAAYVLHRRSDCILFFLFRRSTQLIVYFLALMLISAGVCFPWFNQELYGLLFTVIIVNCAANPDSIVRLEHPLLKYLGKISYGLYMYHPLVIVLVLKSIAACGFQNSFLLYFTCAGISGLVAWCSYEVFEKWFLRQKMKHSTILSGDNVNS